MNKSLSLVLVLCLFSFAARTAHADFVTFPRADAEWTVDISNKATAAAPSAPGSNIQGQAKPKRVEVTQVGRLRRIKISWDNGKDTERWVVTGLPVIFSEDPRNGEVRPIKPGTFLAMLTDLSSSYDTSAFSWITAACLQEKDPISYQGKQCFHYLGGVAIPLAGMSQMQHKREAWIDSATGLPVALDTGDALSVFKFADTPPTGPLVPPPNFQKEITYYKAVNGIP